MNHDSTALNCVELQFEYILISFAGAEEIVLINNFSLIVLFSNIHMNKYFIQGKPGLKIT